MRLSTVWLLLLSVLFGASASEPRSAERADRARGDLRVVVISDLNSRYGSTEYEPAVHEAVRRIREEWRPDLVLAAGDLIAGQDPSLPDARVRSMWAAFDSAVAEPLRQAEIPFGFALGNHDGSAYPAHQRDRRLAVEHWTDADRHPGVEFIDRARYPVYYSFRQGDLFVLVWDATYEETVHVQPMMRWVSEQLAGEAARGARYRWVLGHLPLHAVAEGRDRPGEVLQQPDSLRSLLESYGVGVYISGHHHAYYPGRAGSLELLHAGAVGQGARPLLGTDTPPRQTVTIVDLFFEADSTAYTTYAFDPGTPSLLREVEKSELPPRICGHNGCVERRDLSLP